MDKENYFKKPQIPQKHRITIISNEIIIPADNQITLNNIEDNMVSVASAKNFHFGTKRMSLQRIEPDLYPVPLDINVNDFGKMSARYIDSNDETDSENESSIHTLETQSQTVETNNGFYTDMDTESENETAGLQITHIDASKIDTVTIPPVNKKNRKKRSKASNRKSTQNSGAIFAFSGSAARGGITNDDSAPNIRSVSKPIKKTLVVRQFKSETKSISNTKKTSTKKVNRKVALNVQPNDVQYDLEEEDEIIKQMARTDIPKKPVVKKKILVSAPSRFATNIRNIELNAHKSNTAAENENRSIDLKITEFSTIDSDVFLSEPGVDEIDIPFSSVNSNMQDYNDGNVVDSNSVDHTYAIGEIINLEGDHDSASMPRFPNVDDTNKKILQEISGLGRKVDGNALQNAEIIVQVEDIRKFIIDNMGASSNDWEVREVIPVKNIDEFFDLGPRLTNDPDLRLKMLRHLLNFKGKPDVENPIADHYGSVLQRIAPDSVIDEFNYSGIKGKHMLKGHPIEDLIFDVYKPIDKKMFVKRLKMTIHYAKQRVYGERFRNKK